MIDGDVPEGQGERLAHVELGATASRVSREIVRLHADLFGRGPTKAKTHLADDHVLCVLEQVFTPAEKTLIKAGKQQQVKSGRDAFHDAVETQFREAVEAVTGRTVRAFVSVVSTEIDAAFELFLLEDASSSESEARNERSGNGIGGQADG